MWAICPLAEIRSRAAPNVLNDQQAELAHVTRLLTLGELTASIAHEVNQPLAAIVTNSETCLRLLSGDGPQIEKARAGLAAIIRSALRSSDIIQRLRTMARKADVEKTDLELEAVIREVIPLIDSELSRNEVLLRLDLASGLPPVLGDRVQLQQVLINLLVNAIQTMTQVTDRPRELLIRARLDEDEGVVVSVEDTGPGIDPGTMARLFTPFFTTKANGLGLGLSICRSIAEAHGGRIWASDNRPRGAAFHLSLPARQRAPRRQHREPPRRPAPRFRGAAVHAAG